VNRSSGRRPMQCIRGKHTEYNCTSVRVLSREHGHTDSCLASRRVHVLHVWLPPGLAAPHRLELGQVSEAPARASHFSHSGPTLSSSMNKCWSGFQPGTTISLTRQPMRSLRSAVSGASRSSLSSSGISLAFHHPPGTNSWETSPAAASWPMMMRWTSGVSSGDVGGLMRVYRERPECKR
jgi:hypothetical protein